MQTNESNTQRNTFAPQGASSSGGHGSSYLGPGLQIKGEISGNEDLRLDSKVEGSISIGGFRLTVGSGARLDADVVAREAVISGEVNGDIRAHDRIEILKSATVIGDLTTSKIVIEEGAYMNGGIEIGNLNKPIGTDLDTLLKGSKKA
jgi:cytoskeletal protein CcmA (bactofilin family)